MPELPEVETIKRSLVGKVTGKMIADVEIIDEKLVQKISAREFATTLSGKTITKVGRRGKYLLFYLDGLLLICHLRMTGQFVYQEQETPRKHVRAVFEMKTGERLLFCDTRRFGTFELKEQDTAFKVHPLASLGEEPLEISQGKLARNLKKRTGLIKPLLLNQAFIAGLGNIYVNEILFRSGISPKRRGNTLSEAEVKRLHNSIVAVICEAIQKRGTTISDYIDSEGRRGQFQEELQVYGHKGEPCPRCGRPIIREVVAGRSSFYCRECQG